MATDDERRRVAAALRKCRGGWSSGECYYAILHALDLPDTSREDGGHALYGALSDLIDPDCGTEEVSTSQVPKCDRDALLALAEDVDEAAAMATVMDASEGAKLLAELLLDIVRRIREACGVVA